MDCRAIRSLLKESVLSPEQEAGLAAHLVSCPACADDASDPIGQLLRQTSLPVIQPPPMLATAIIARLPPESPGILYARAQQQQRRRTLLASMGLLCASVLMLIVTVWLRLAERSSAQILAMWGGPATVVAHFLLRLILVSKSVLQSSTPMIMLLLMFVVLVGMAVRRLPTLGLPRSALTTVMGLGLVVAVLTRYPFLDNPSMLQRPIYSFSAPITVASGATGDVLSLFGDIQLQGNIQGDVATLGGKVTLAPSAKVGGSVLSGAGPAQANSPQIAGAMIGGFGSGPAFAEVTPTGSSAGQGNLTRLGSLLGAFVTLLLAGLWLMLQGERLCSASEQLRMVPLKALGLGLAATLVLAVLCAAASTVLAATLFGTVLIPLVLLLIHLPYLHGIAIVGQALGVRVGGSDEPRHGLWGIGIQAVVVIALALLAPLASLVTFYLLGSFGLGAALLTARRPQLSF